MLCWSVRKEIWAVNKYWRSDPQVRWDLLKLSSFSKTNYWREWQVGEVLSAGERWESLHAEQETVSFLHETAALQEIREKLDFLGLWLIGNLIKLIGTLIVFHKLSFINQWMTCLWKIRPHCRRQDHLSHPSEVERKLWLPRKFSCHGGGGAVV